MDFKEDYTLLLYPFHVLSTNRILESIISRNRKEDKTIRMFSDFKDIKKLHGLRGFYLGLSPYLLNYGLNNIEFFGNSDEELEHPLGKYWFGFSIALWNPVNMLIVRMQCLDYEHRKLRHAVRDMIKHDRI